MSFDSPDGWHYEIEEELHISSFTFTSNTDGVAEGQSVLAVDICCGDSQPQAVDAYGDPAWRAFSSAEGAPPSSIRHAPALLYEISDELFRATNPSGGCQSVSAGVMECDQPSGTSSFTGVPAPTAQVEAAVRTLQPQVPSITMIIDVGDTAQQNCSVMVSSDGTVELRSPDDPDRPDPSSVADCGNFVGTLT